MLKTEKDRKEEVNRIIDGSLRTSSYVSLPIMKRRKEECTPYALRLTPDGKYGDIQVQDFLSNFDDYIYVNELSKKKKPHLHAVLFTKLHEEELRQKIREFLLKYFTGPPKRGDANRQYNLSEVEDVELAITYILKDSTQIFHSDNINMETIDKLKKKSYQKYSKEEFAIKLEELKKHFKDTNPSLGEMMTSIVQLKALYRQPINMNYIYQISLSFKLHNNPGDAENYVREFLSRFS